MTEPSLERGRLLLHQGRWEQAEGEFRRAVGERPDAPEAHALLALALLERERWDEATAAARTAIGLAPDWPFTHYVHAMVLYRRHRLAEALAAANEAVGLDPDMDQAHALIASIHLDESRFADALASAERALEVDPEQVWANNLRAIALTKLGRRAEAGATIDATLARDPDNAVSHANRGWTLLEAGDRERALHHFREALRLEPDNEWARHGILEALKAKRWIYAVMLKYFFWMSRLTPRAQWGVIVGGYIGNRVLTTLRQANPALAPFIGPIQVLYLVFVFLTWTADPLANLLLRLDPFGRLVLDEEQVRASNWIGGTLLLAFTLGAAAFLVDVEGLGLLAGACAFMLIPISATFKAPDGWPRRAMTGYTAAMAALLAVAAGGMLRADPAGADVLAGVTGAAVLGFVVMLIGVSWFANWIISRRPTR